MKKLIMLLFGALLLAGVTGCSKDDESIDKDLLVGKWIQTAEYDGEYDEWRYFEDDTHYTLFNADGTGAQGNKSYADKFTYRCEGNRLYIIFDGEKEGDWSTVETLTSTEFAVVSQEYEGEHGGTFTDKATFKRGK